MSMSHTTITLDRLSKRYRIGAKQQRQDTLAASVLDLVRRPMTNLRRLRSLTTFSDTETEDDTIWALRDVSFEIKSGETVGIIGSNGAGKSTLLKILSRITQPSHGTAVVNGRVSSLLEVGTGFHADLTGRENVYLNGAILGMTRNEIDRKFDDIVDFSDVAKFIDTPVKRYSSGMTLRLAFSVAAHLEPEILMVDEVLAVGDIRFQKKCLSKMGDVASEGRTVLYVAHNMPAISRLCQRAILMGNGQVVQDGPVHEVISTYLNSGLGTSAMREWPDLAQAPGGDIARLCSVRVAYADGDIADTVDIRKSFQISMEYEVADVRVCPLASPLRLQRGRRLRLWRPGSRSRMARTEAARRSLRQHCHNPRQSHVRRNVLRGREHDRGGAVHFSVPGAAAQSRLWSPTASMGIHREEIGRVTCLVSSGRC